MKISKKATSIVEAVIVILIVSMGVVGMYKIFFNSNALIDSTENKIKAISIAREGIEAMTNIRDKNWLILGSDYVNCWNTFNYDPTCVGNIKNSTQANSTDIGPGSYIIYKDLDNNWKLRKYTTGVYTDVNYRTNFRVGLSGSGFYTQTGTTTNLKPVFTREILINYIEDTNSDGSINSNDEKMKVSSIVRWADRSGNKNHEIKFESVLTNWKNKK